MLKSPTRERGKHCVHLLQIASFDMRRQRALCDDVCGTT
jgi:hypothetical protein